MMYGQSVRRILGTSGLQEPPTYDDPLIKIRGLELLIQDLPDSRIWSLPPIIW